MPIPKGLEKTDSPRHDGEEPCETRKVRHSPYGPWGPGYRLTSRLPAKDLDTHMFQLLFLMLFCS